MKLTRWSLLLVILIAIVSSILGRSVAPYIYGGLNTPEGFENKNLDVFQRLLQHIDIVDIKLRDEAQWWQPEMSKAIAIKGLSNGVFINPKSKGNPPLSVHGMPYNRGGIRLCDDEPCSDRSQWSLEFSTSNDLLYRVYPNGNMPAKEENERKRLILTPGSWFASIPHNQTNVVNRPPPSWFSGSR